MRSPLLRSALAGFAIASVAMLAACSKETKKSTEPLDTPTTGTTSEVGSPPMPPVNLTRPEGVTGVPVNPRNKVPVVTPDAPNGDSSYLVSLDVPASVAPGSEGVVLVKVVPKTGWKMNFEFPTRLQIAPPAGVTLAKPQQSREDAEAFEEKGATFAVKFTADAAGAKEFTGKFSFAVCTDATCDPKRSELAWSLNVQ